MTMPCQNAVMRGADVICACSVDDSGWNTAMDGITRANLAGDTAARLATLARNPANPSQFGMVTNNGTRTQPLGKAAANFTPMGIGTTDARTIFQTGWNLLNDSTHKPDNDQVFVYMVTDGVPAAPGTIIDTIKAAGARIIVMVFGQPTDAVATTYRNIASPSSYFEVADRASAYEIVDNLLEEWSDCAGSPVAPVGSPVRTTECGGWERTSGCGSVVPSANGFTMSNNPCPTPVCVSGTPTSESSPSGPTSAPTSTPTSESSPSGPTSAPTSTTTTRKVCVNLIRNGGFESTLSNWQIVKEDGWVLLPRSDTTNSTVLSMGYDGASPESACSQLIQNSDFSSLDHWRANKGTHYIRVVPSGTCGWSLLMAHTGVTRRFALCGEPADPAIVSNIAHTLTSPCPSATYEQDLASFIRAPEGQQYTVALLDAPAGASLLGTLFRYTGGTSRDTTTDIVFRTTTELGVTTDAHIFIVCPPNEPPIANPVTWSVATWAPPQMFDITAFVSDTDADEVSLISCGVPEYGTLSVTSGKLLYVPDPRSPRDALMVTSYTVSDGYVEVVGELRILTAPNHPPVANPVTVGATGPTVVVVPPVYDIDGDALTISAPGQPVTDGVISLPVAGPRGTTLTFEYSVTDGHASASNVISVVIPPNRPPVAEAFNVEATTTVITLF